MTEYRKGQRVRVEFEAKVCLADDEGVLELRTDDGMFYYVKPPVEPSVKITPLDPPDELLEPLYGRLRTWTHQERYGRRRGQ